ncbi:MAG: hypothetical protein NTW21_40625 [Verrucomicrobia bacterium]|nr:hypothetical protein [Verrucomicrobiota bacterium]
MKAASINTTFSRLALLAIAACGLVSCATVEHPLTRHDMDGDGAISHSEYQQQHLQYNLASRQRADEYSRARLATALARPTASSTSWAISGDEDASPLT